jgi:hypothetical protein
MTPDADTVETDLHYNCLINSCEAEPVVEDEPVVEPATEESENVDKTD